MTEKWKGDGKSYVSTWQFTSVLSFQSVTELESVGEKYLGAVEVNQISVWGILISLKEVEVGRNDNLMAIKVQLNS